MEMQPERAAITGTNSLVCPFSLRILVCRFRRAGRTCLEIKPDSLIVAAPQDAAQNICRTFASDVLFGAI